MAYRAVGTPRFFIDHLLWLKTLGLEYYTAAWGGVITSREDLIGLNPAQNHLINVAGYTPPSGSGVYITFPAAPSIITEGDKWKAYIAVLGHNSASAGAKLKFYEIDATGNDLLLSPVSAVNYSHGSTAPYDGFTIAYDLSSHGSHIRFGFNPVNETGGYDADFNIGCLSHGNYFDMPHSPDLKLTLGYETGTKNIETKGGASLSNTMWRPPMWGDLGPWELSDPDSPTNNQTLAHSSRRIWNLSFSFLSQTDTFPKYNALNRLVDMEETVPDDETLLTSDDFFSQVWNRVGTALPFIFQPDKDVNEFAIAKFDQKNISFQQQSPSLYSCSLKIREIW